MSERSRVACATPPGSRRRTATPPTSSTISARRRGRVYVGGADPRPARASSARNASAGTTTRRPSRSDGRPPVRAGSWAVDRERRSTTAASLAVNVARRGGSSRTTRSPRMRLLRERHPRHAGSATPESAIDAQRGSIAAPFRPFEMRDETVRHTCRFRTRNLQVRASRVVFPGADTPVTQNG